MLEFYEIIFFHDHLAIAKNMDISTFRNKNFLSKKFRKYDYTNKMITYFWIMSWVLLKFDKDHLNYFLDTQNY